MASVPKDGDRGVFDKLGRWRLGSAVAQKDTIAVTSCSPSTRLARDASVARLRAPVAAALRDWWPTAARASCGAG
jgi:hypothetical protein